MNGWFPRINLDGSIASGDTSVWVDGALVAPVGGGPAWAARTLVYNNREGGTVVGADTVPTEYNALDGSDDGRWAGFFAPGGGRVDIYSGTTLTRSILGGCCPRFAPGEFAFLHPYDQTYRALILNDVVVARNNIMDVQLSRGGEFYVYLQATGTYTRQILDAHQTVISINEYEAPLVAFVGPAGEPWMLSAGAKDVAFVRPLYSPFGYRIEGELFYPDARMSGGKLRVVGSLSNGTPRFDIWIDFAQPRQDLRLAAPPVEPPIEPPGPIDPPVEPPIEPPTPEPPSPFRTHKGLTMDIDGKIVILRGPEGKLASPDAPNTGTWGDLGAGWRGVAWAGAHDGSAACRHRAVKLPNGRYLLVSEAHNGLAGADATKHSGAIDQQFYYKPDGNPDAGGYEQWRVYDGNENGAIEAQIEYTDDAGRYFSCPLAVEVVE